MVTELPADHVSPLIETNMFCFDSEVFRYLAITRTQGYSES